MRILLLSLLLSHALLFSKNLIITHAYNRPDFIAIQEKTFKRFLQDDYEFVVFNDAPDQKIRRDIIATCKKLQLNCINIPQEIHDRPYLKRLPGENYNHSCVRCANVVQYSLDILGLKHNDIVVIIDSDMFLVKEFNIKDYLHNFHIAAVLQSRDNKEYVWNGLVFLNVPLLLDRGMINFNCGMLGTTPVDVGGYMYYYLKKHPELPLKAIEVDHFNDDNPQKYTKGSLQKNGCFDSAACNFLMKKPDNVEFLVDGTFLHYRGGGNWNNKSESYHDTKTKLLNAYIASLLS